MSKMPRSSALRNLDRHPDPGPLRAQFVDARTASGLNSDDLTVLEHKHDPYRQDTPALRRDAVWFADQVARFLPGGQTVHLRGIFYRIVAHGRIRKPDRTVFTNTDDNWEWMTKVAAKAARWLGLVPFERIVDERNAAPEIVEPPAAVQPEWFLSSGVSFGTSPDLGGALPRYCMFNFTPPPQPFRLILIGEKVSLAGELRSVATEVGAELVLPTGDLSDTLIYGIAKRADEDGRPAAIFYFSDFDPAGWTMPVGLSRKLQALRDLYFPDLDVQVHAVALNLDQVTRLDLPSTPLKATEIRADRWREAMGHEQTEIDALLALHPGEVARLARQACKPFWDPTLRGRVFAAQSKYQRIADERLEAHPEYAAARTEIEDALAAAESAVADLEQAQDDAREALDGIEMPPLDLPAPELGPMGETPTPLFSTDDDWVDATHRLIERKGFRP